MDASPPAAALSISPLTNAFGSVAENTTSAALTFTVTNTGGSTSGQVTPSISGAASADYAVATNGCTTLAAGANCTISVTFTPTAAGDRAASLVVMATPGGSVTAALDGTGLAPGSITINPTSKGFGNEVVGTATATQTFTISNPGGTATGSLTASLTGNDSGDFAISNDTCTGQTVANGATCTVDVAFDPQSAGPKTASLSISGTPGGTVTADLSGTGQAPANIVVVPNLEDFGSVVTSQSSSNVTFTVSNTGDVATGALAHSITGTDAADFAFVNGNCDGTTLAHLQTCTVVLKFAPTTTGSKGATLQLTATPGGTGSSTLSGTAIAPGAIAFTGATLPPLSFGNITVGQSSASQTLTVTNTGAASTGTLTTALGGTNPSEFVIVSGSNGCQGVALAAGASCTIAIQFAPSSGGVKSANLNIAGSPGGSINAQLGGNAIPPAKLTIDKASKDYGSVGVGESSPTQAFVITNVGGQISGALSVALNGANSTQFNIMSEDCTGNTLDVGKTCTVNVRFSPTANGNYTASLDVSATPGGTVSAGLFGIGVTPADITVTGVGTFSTIGLIGDAAQTATFTVKNTGAEQTGTIGISITGSTDFTQTSTCTTLLQDATCTITVSFAPSVVSNSISGDLVVTASPGGSVTTALSGKGKHRLEISKVNPADDGAGTFDFNGVVVNTNAPPTVEITVINNTTADMTLNDTPLTSGAFTYTGEGDCAGVTLTKSTNPGDGSGGTCTAVVQFLPTAPQAYGPTSIVFDIGSGPANQATEKVKGTGVNSLQINPTSDDFKTVAVGTTSSTNKTFTVSNPLNAPNAGPINVSISTGPFHIVSDACAGATLDGAGGATSQCAITVAFTPTTTGSTSATLTVKGNPGGTITATVNGTGGNNASVAITGTADFGSVFAGKTKALTYTITNNGDVNTTLNSTTIVTATGTSSFTQTGGTCMASQVLKPGAANACTVIGTFAPADADIGATGSAAPTGTLTVKDSISGTHTLTLTGTSESTISMTGTPGFGQVVAGQQAKQTFTVTNNSGAAVSVSSITTGSALFTIMSNTCTGSITSCSFDVVFTAPTPAGMAATEAETANLNVVATHGAATASLTATALSVAQLAITPATADFGSALVGTTGITQTYTVQNVGGQASGTVTASLAGSNFAIVTDNCAGKSLAGQTGTCTVIVKFAPPVGGSTMDGTLTAMASPGGMATATATGTVIASGGVTLTPVTGDFGSAEDGSTTGTTLGFTVQNTSSTVGATLSIATTDSAGGNRFTVLTGSGTDCGTSLAAGGSCTVRVQFAPQGTYPSGDRGTITGKLTIGGGAYANLQGNALLPPGIDVTATLTTTGEEGGAGCSGSNCTIDFPYTGDGFTSSATVTLTNKGDVSSGAVAISSLAGSDPTQFKIPAGSDGCEGKALTGTGTPGASCTFVVQFAPTQTLNRSASFTVGATPGLSSTTFDLFGYALAPSSLSFEPTAQTVASPLPVGNTTEVIYQVINAFSGDTGPMTFSLGDSTNFAIDTTSPDLTVDNGGEPFTLPNCDLGGAGNSLGAGQECALGVIFQPQVPNAGLSTTISVTANPGATTPVTATLAGDGASALAVDNTEPTFNAPAANESSAPVTLTFTNNAGVATGLLSSVLGGTSPSQFSIVSDDCAGEVLGPYDGMSDATDSCQITVVFIPVAGSTNATLTVSGTPGNSATATLNGVVGAP